MQSDIEERLVSALATWDEQEKTEQKTEVVTEEKPEVAPEKKVDPRVSGMLANWAEEPEIADRLANIEGHLVAEQERRHDEAEERDIQEQAARQNRSLADAVKAARTHYSTSSTGFDHRRFGKMSDGEFLQEKEKVFAAAMDGSLR